MSEEVTEQSIVYGWKYVDRIEIPATSKSESGGDLKTRTNVTPRCASREENVKKIDMPSWTACDF